MPRIDSTKFYKNAIKKYGVSPQGVCWIDAKRQYLRFDMIYSLLPDVLSPFCIADAGCGFGDFYKYMSKNENLPDRYIGIDSVDDMCKIAYKMTKQKIIKADILRDHIPCCDYYICSGAMNILTKFETVMFINNCYKASKKGFIFNILYGETNSQTYNYVSKEIINKIAKDINVKSVKILDEYMQNDITVGFFK